MPVAPMLATAGELPPTDGHWAAEVKWDGVRLVFDDGRAWTRNGVDATARWPELRELTRRAVRGCAIDGEVVSLDPATGTPSFARLQRRLHVIPTAAVLADIPSVFMAFDLPRHPGSYDERRAALESLGLSGPCVAVPVPDDDPAALFAATGEQGLEGIVAKRRDSRYEPGRRSASWLKVKHLRTLDVVVGGFRAGQGRRLNGLGSLLVGQPGPAGLRYIGHVGTGFTDAERDRVRGLLTLRATSPFAEALSRADARSAVWVEPTLRVEVTFHELTPDGRLRHPVYRATKEGQ